MTGLDDRGNPVTRTTVTNPDGTWAITDLPPSDTTGYTVTETQPAGWLDGSDVASRNGTISNDRVSGVQIAAGQIKESGNFGEIAPVSVGNTVWDDRNANGLQDAGEPGIGEVTVTLSGTNDLGEPVSMSLTTNADGSYLFSGLRPGTYTITFTDPAGHKPTYAGLGTDRGRDSDPVVSCRCIAVTLLGNPTLTDASSNRTDIDAGFYRPGSVTGFVYNDNTHVGGIAARPNQTVIIQGAGPDGVIGTSDDPAPITTTTDAAGRYHIGDLPPGTYAVTTTGKAATLVEVPAGSTAVADFPYPPVSVPSKLPTTGSNVLDMLLYGLVLCLAGGALVLGSRRRKTLTV